MFNWFKTNIQLRDEVVILQKQLALAQEQKDFWIKTAHNLRYGVTKVVREYNQGEPSSIRTEPSHELGFFLSKGE